MPAKTLLAILFVLSVAVAAFVVIRALPPAPEQAAGQPDREILVAAAPLGPGTLLRIEDVRWWAPPNGVTFAGEIVRPPASKREARPEADEEARAEVRGAALRTSVATGAPVERGNLAKPGDRDFLRVVLTAENRAVSIPTSAGTGLLSPGDRVDVILTQTFRTDAPASRRSVSETIGEYLRVLAVEGKGDGGPRTVILEVTAEQVEKLNVANELGKLTLALRSTRPAGRANVSDPGDTSRKPIWAGDVSNALAGPSPQAPVFPADRPTVRVLHGTKNAESVKQE